MDNLQRSVTGASSLHYSIVVLRLTILITAINYWTKTRVLPVQLLSLSHDNTRENILEKCW